jgi:ankyrin repeat protein
VEALLKQGVEPNQFDAFGYTPLTVASLDKHLQCMKSLLAHGANVNLASAGGWSPLIGAAMSGAKPEVLDVLLDKGADINARNQWGCTALYYAAGYGVVKTVDHLLKRGAAVPGTTGECLTPLRLAELRGYPAVIERLKQAEKAGAAEPAKAATEQPAPKQD